MTIQEMIDGIEDMDWHAMTECGQRSLESTITILERVKRLEEILLDKIEGYNYMAPSSTFTQKQQGANDERHYVKRFLKTGEEW